MAKTTFYFSSNGVGGAYARKTAMAMVWTNSDGKGEAIHRGGLNKAFTMEVNGPMKVMLRYLTAPNPLSRKERPWRADYEMLLDPSADAAYMVSVTEVATDMPKKSGCFASIFQPAKSTKNDLKRLGKSLKNLTPGEIGKNHDPHRLVVEKLPPGTPAPF